MDSPLAAGRAVAAAYRRLLAAQVRSQTQYRASFVLDAVLNGTLTALDLVYVLALFHVTDALAGFGVTDVLLMVGIAGVAFALADLVVGNIERLPVYVRTGQLDAVLVRPLGALGQLLVGDVALRRLGRVAQTTLVLVVALVLADIDWTPARAVLVVSAPLSGAVLFGALFVTGATFTFWLIDAGQVAHAFTYGGRDFTGYPVPVYGSVLRRVFAYGLGLGFVAYWPALGLLGRDDPLGLPGWLAWCSPVAALAWVGIASLAWRAGLRQYGGTGS